MVSSLCLQDPPLLILRVVCRLFEFQRHYENQVAPLLIQADIQIAQIDEMSARDWQDDETKINIFNQKQILIRGASIQALSCVRIMFFAPPVKQTPLTTICG